MKNRYYFITNYKQITLSFLVFCLLNILSTDGLFSQAINPIVDTSSKFKVTGALYDSIAQDTIVKSKPYSPIKNFFSQDTTRAAKTTMETLKPPELKDIISGANIFWTVVFLLIGYFTIKLVIFLVGSFAKRYEKYEFTLKRLIPIIRIISWILLIYIIIIGIYNPPAATIFAFLASVGVAVGFAAQDLLKNIFGGLVVMVDRPFQIGDKIESGKYYGEVVEIGIRSTKIVTPDDSMVTVPNSEFMIQYVSNSNSGENNCQVVAEIFLPIDIDTALIRDIATEAARVSRYIYLNKPVVVLFFNEIKEKKPVLKMRLKAYVSDLSQEFYFKSEMTEIVLKTLIEKEIIPEGFYKG